MPAARSDNALTLNSGDTATVSGAGTVGTIGGTAVNDKTNSYTNNSGDAMTAFGDATFTLDAGGTLTGGDAGLITAYGSSAEATINGGAINGATYGISDNGSGSVTVYGGTITSPDTGILNYGSSSTVTITGGNIRLTAPIAIGLVNEPSDTIDLFSETGTSFTVSYDGGPQDQTFTGGALSGTVRERHHQRHPVRRRPDQHDFP